MAVLSKQDINERRKLPVTEAKNLVITPILDEEVFDEDSVDLRLGTYFLLPQIPPQPFVDPTSPGTASQSYLRLQTPLGAYFVLPAHQTVLGATLEYIKLPFDISGQILTKSSVARMFMVIETAPWIHPLYRGCLTLEIANVSNTAIVLYPGMTIGQLILLQTSVAEQPAKLSGTYVGPVYPEPPMLREPGQALYRIGLEKYRHPLYGWINEKNMARQRARDPRKNRLWASIQPDVRMVRAREDVGRAIGRDEEDALLEACRASRSRSLYPAVLIALNTCMRY